MKQPFTWKLILLAQVFGLAMLPASATWAAPILEVSAQAGFFTPACNCSFIPEVLDVTATGTDRSPISVGISFGHHQAEAIANYGILGALASTNAPEPGVPPAASRRHHSAAQASWQDSFLIGGGTGQGILIMPILVHGHLTAEGTDPSSSGVSFSINGNPFQGGAGILPVVTSTPLDVNEIIQFQYTFEYDNAFEIIAQLNVFADAYINASSASDFFGTAIVTSAIVIDPNTGLPATGAVIETGSGTDYSNLAINAVPEPSTILLLGSGLAGLATLRLRSGQAWRRKRQG